MLTAQAVAVSAEGKTLGLRVGIPGAQALDILRGPGPHYPLPQKVPIVPPAGEFDWSGLTW